MSRHRVDRLQSYFDEGPERGVAAVYLFGSRSLGRHWDRILGIALLLDPERHPEPRGRSEVLEGLAPELAELGGGSRLDLLVLNDTPPLTARRIVREGRRLTCALPAVDRDFVRDVQVRAIDVEAFLNRPRRPRLEPVPR